MAALRWISWERSTKSNDWVIFIKKLFPYRLVQVALAKCKGQSRCLGKTANIKGSSDLYGVNFQIHSRNFKNYQDTILLVDKGRNKFRAP
jgi:hypothetical protein